MVDDNPSSLKLVAYLVKKSGWDVAEASNAKAALAAIQLRRPNIVVMDLFMPEVDGLALTRALKADPTTRDIPIVVMTASCVDEHRAQAMAAGVAAYVTKPVDTRKLPELLAELDAGRERLG